MKRLFLGIILFILVDISGCQAVGPMEAGIIKADEKKQTGEIRSEKTVLANGEEEEEEMRLYIGNREIPVKWEENQTVRELQEEAMKGEIVVQMSGYSDFEQVGSLGRSYSREDRKTTTENSDIVLYSGDQIVVFYGSNSWAYTRLGKMDLPKAEVTELLSNGDVTLTIRM